MYSSSNASTSSGGYSSEDFDEPSVSIVSVSFAYGSEICQVDVPGGATNLVVEHARVIFYFLWVMTG